MSVHYKFKSSIAYDTVTFDGLHISVGDLKKSIIQQKKIGRSSDFNLQITNAQTNDVYQKDDELIPKNTSVVVARIPITNSTKKSWDRPDSSMSMLAAKSSDSPDGLSFDKIAKTADLTSINASEDDKIKAMMTQATQDYDPSKYQKIKGMSGPLPANYTCFRCGKPGHWIKNCPTNTFEVKRSTGIPRSFMVAVEGPEVPGALLTNTGHFAVPVIDHEAYKEGKKEKPPFAREVTPEKEEKPSIPEELLCMICRDLLSDAVLIPCCGNSYCDECVRQALLDSDEHECPTCHEKDISPDTLIPNRFLRTAVINFKNETGYTKIKRLLKPLSESSVPQSSSPMQAEIASSSVSPSRPPITVPEPKQSEQVSSSSQLIGSISANSGATPDDLATDDRPDTPVCDEKPDSLVASTLPPARPPVSQQLTVNMPSSRPLQQVQVPHLHHDYEPPAHHHQHLPPPKYDHNKQGGYSIATITTRTSVRHPFPQVHNPPSYPPKRSHPGPHSGPHSHMGPHTGPGSIHQRNSHMGGRPYSPNRDRYHSGSSRNYNQPSPYNSMPPNVPPPSAHNAVMPHMHGPPPPHLFPPPIPVTGNMYPPNQPPPSKMIPPRGSMPPGYPPQPPPPGAMPLGPPPFAQPPPPGIGMPPPPLGPQHHGNYEYYKDKPKNALEDFERELMMNKFDRPHHSSRSSSRSYISSRSSSRSRSHSLSRSLTHSSRSHSRSRSYSYSRSRSSSVSRSRSRSRSRSHSPYRRRSRTRSRSRERRYSPGYRRSRSRSPYVRSRSPYRRGGGYSPSYYNSEYGGYQPTAVGGNFPVDGRNRYYQHNYRGYEEFHHYGGEQQRFEPQHDQQHQHFPSRFNEYGRGFEDSYRGHDKHRSWTPEGREKEKHESRKAKVQDVKKDERSRPKDASKDKENDKRALRRHKPKTSKKEKEEARSSKDPKSSREGISQRHEPDDYYHESKGEEKPESSSKSRSSSKKSGRHSESETESKSKDKRHKSKSKKSSQESGKSKKREKATIEESNPSLKEKEQSSRAPSPPPKFTNKRFKPIPAAQSQPWSQKPGKEETMVRERVNPNIIVIRTDSELKMKHVIKEADSTNNIHCQENIEGTVDDKNFGAEMKDEPDSISEAANVSNNSGDIDTSHEGNLDDQMQEDDMKLEMEEIEEEVVEDLEVEEELEDDEEQEGEEDDAEGGVLELEEESETGDPVLTARIPELSKWEREDSEAEESTSKTDPKSLPSPQNAKSLPPDIVERAEKAILLKPVKPTPAMNDSSKISTKQSDKRSTEKPSEKLQLKVKLHADAQETKNEASTLQVTVSTTKDKRSVETKESGTRDKKDHEEGRNKGVVREKIKLDRSKFQTKPFYEGGSSSSHRSAKSRSTRRSPDRNSSYSPKRESGSEDSRHPMSPKRGGENRHKKRKNLDEKSMHHVTMRHESLERTLLTRQHEQQTRKETARHYKEMDDLYRRGKDSYSERSRVRERSEKEGSREIDSRSRSDGNERENISRGEKERFERKASASRGPSPKRSNKVKDEYDQSMIGKHSLPGKSSRSSGGDKQSPSYLPHVSEWPKDDKYKLEDKFSHDRFSNPHEPMLKQRERKKSTIDESKFEPNYDMSSDSDESRSRGHATGNERKELTKQKRSRSPSPDRTLKKVKKENEGTGITDAKNLEHAESQKMDDEDSSSSSSSDSGTATPVSVGSPAAVASKAKSDSAPQALKEKHKKKKSKHKKHKKHKPKHKKRKHKKHKKEKEAKAKLSSANLTSVKS